MKILWISPWFGNYRIPVYENLNKLCSGNFYLICSEENTSELVRGKLKAVLGNHAIVMSGEQRMTMGSDESDFSIVSNKEATKFEENSTSSSKAKVYSEEDSSKHATR